jgi:zinc transporter ZupT
MSLLPFLILASVVATYLGGMIARKYRDRLHVILGFSGGTMIGVALIHLLPESAEILSIETASLLMAFGFCFYLFLDRFILLHSHESEHDHTGHTHSAMGPATLCIHSMVDGFALASAFLISPAFGGVVALAVIAHKFSDGVNVIALTHAHPKSSRLWLTLDSLAPIVGAVLVFLIPESMSTTTLPYLLAVFSGFFLYIASSDLIPESHHAHPKLLTTILTISGVLLMALLRGV